MIAEKWNALSFDINKLQAHLKDHVLNLDPIFQSTAFGGWSVLSSDGSYKDGWFQGHKMYDNRYNQEQVKAELKQEKAKRQIEYTIPTDICSGYLKEVVDKITEFGLGPHRARIIRLTANSACSWHRDAPENVYAVRLHVPIITNDHCFFETETDRAHLPADGSVYFLYVNRLHRVVNWGTTHRYNLVMDVIDKDKNTKFHRYEDFEKK